MSKVFTKLIEESQNFFQSVFVALQQTTQADVDMIFSSGHITLYGNLVPYNHVRH